MIFTGTVPPASTKMPHGKVRYYYNVVATTETIDAYDEKGKSKGTETHDAWTCDYVDLEKGTKPDKDTLVNTMIRKKYSLSNELGILRQRDVNDEHAAEFENYNAYVEACKKGANQILASL